MWGWQAASSRALPSFYHTVLCLASSNWHLSVQQEAACGCAGIFSAPVALQLYAQMFENAGHLQHLEAFASHSGADFYGLPRNEGTIQLIKQPLEVPTLYAYHDTDVVPICAGKTLEWDLASS